MNKQTKLDKKLTQMNVWALALGCIIGWGAFVMPGNTFLPKAGPVGTAIAMALAAFIMIIISFNYNYMINRYPVAGGEFAYAQKTFGEKHGFLCAWFLGLSYLAIVPLNATALALIGRNLMHNVFQIGYHYSVAGYDVYVGEIVLAITALLFFAYLSIKGVKFAGVFQTILVAALVTGVFVVSLAVLFNDGISITSLKPYYYEEKTMISGVLAVVAVAPWAFVGFDTIPQAAEEFKFSHKKTISIMVLSIVFGALVYIALNTITASIYPDNYNSWKQYIDDLPNLKGLSALPTFNAAYMLLGNTGLLFISVAVLAAILSGIVGFYMATSRLLYSMAIEGVIPKWFGHLHSQYKTPRNAILFVLAISIIAPFFGRNALGWIVDMSSLGAAIGYGYTSAAAFKYARSENNKFISFTGVIGSIMGVVFALLLLIPIPMLNCSLGKESYVCLIAWILLGVFFFMKKGYK